MSDKFMHKGQIL